MSTLLAYLTRQRRWTARGAVEEYGRVATELDARTARTVSERQWKRWCDGASRPKPGAWLVLEAMTGHSVDDLLGEYKSDISTGETLTPTLDLKGLMTMATRRSHDRIAAAEAANVGPETLGDVREEIGSLSRSFPRVALPALLPSLIETQNSIFKLLEGKQRPSATRDLYLFAAMATGLVSWAVGALADRDGAFTHARLAHVCADQADHAGMRAWARGLQSMTAYWDDRPAEALRYARAGIDEAGELVSTTAARLASLEARALARLGRPIETLRALERAESMRERAQPDELDELGGQLMFTMPHQMYYRADTMVQMPSDRAEAERAASDAVTAYERASEAEWSYGDMACSRAVLASARVQRGDIDGAYEALRPLLQVPPEERTDGVISLAKRVADETKRIDSPLAQTMREEIEEFARTRPPFRPR